MSSHFFHVPGKLMLTGEWSILTPGHSCITLPTNGINVTIVPSTYVAITSANYGLKNYRLDEISENYSGPALFLITALKEISAQLFGDESFIFDNKKEPFHLILENHPSTYITQNNVMHKLGIGSSACTVVGLTKALALFYNIDCDNTMLFRIAHSAHYKAQGLMGSGFDIAAAISGTYTHYQAATKTGGATFVPIILAAHWPIAVGFSGTSASTSALITIFNQVQKKQNNIVSTILEKIEQCVRALVDLLKNQDPQIDNALKIINQNQALLSQLSVLCHNALETPPITHMIKIAQAHGAAAKFSGAGGGDCVIALCPTKEIKNAIYIAWTAAGFTCTENLLLKNYLPTKFSN